MRRRTLGYIAIALAPLCLTVCTESTVNSLTLATVSIQDECDPASFNAALGAGACVRQGNMTLSQFNAELAANQSVAAWRFVPTELTIRAGQSIEAMNFGGETHTFTEVEVFGGGIVPALNEASGNLVVAPECSQLTSTDMIAAGAKFNTGPENTVETEHYQCCIHPWMRANVTVTAP